MFLSKNNLLHTNSVRHIEDDASFYILALSQALYWQRSEGERKDKMRAALSDFGRNQGSFLIHATDHRSSRRLPEK